jgi:hypothetical protein
MTDMHGGLLMPVGNGGGHGSGYGWGWGYGTPNVRRRGRL